MRTFAETWDETAWIKSFRTSPKPYIRPREDDDWKIRIRVLQQLVAAGDEGVPPLLSALEEADEPLRILAAQALGYLPIGEGGRPRVRDALLSTARDDASAAVRLYAIDSLGMLGGDVRAELELLVAREPNRDAKMHIRYALEREGRALDPEVRQRLVEWDAATADSADIGEPAPDFDLPSLAGGHIRLSDFRGKKAVVLVFVYGDT
jgi:hypothetical protein